MTSVIWLCQRVGIIAIRGTNGCHFHRELVEGREMTRMTNYRMPNVEGMRGKNDHKLCLAIRHSGFVIGDLT